MEQSNVTQEQSTLDQVNPSQQVRRKWDAVDVSSLNFWCECWYNVMNTHGETGFGDAV